MASKKSQSKEKAPVEEQDPLSSEASGVDDGRTPSPEGESIAAVAQPVAHSAPVELQDSLSSEERPAPPPQQPRENPPADTPRPLQSHGLLLAALLVAIVSTTGGAAVGSFGAVYWTGGSCQGTSSPPPQPQLPTCVCDCSTCTVWPTCPVESAADESYRVPDGESNAVEPHEPSTDSTALPTDAAAAATADDTDDRRERAELAERVKEAAKWLMVSYVDAGVDADLPAAELEELMARLEATRDGLLSLETPDEHAHFGPLLRAGTVSAQRLADALMLVRQVRRTLQHTGMDEPAHLVAMDRNELLEVLAKARGAIPEREAAVTALTARYAAHAAPASLSDAASSLRLEELRAEVKRMGMVDRVAKLYKEAGAAAPAGLVLEDSAVLARHVADMHEQRVQRRAMLRHQLEDAGVGLSTGKALDDLDDAEEEYESRRVDRILRIQERHATTGSEAPAHLDLMTEGELQAAHDAAMEK